MFPPSEEDLQKENREKEQRAAWNPDAATVRKNFDDVRAELARSKLRGELEKLIHHMKHRDRQCNKIVVFGAGTMCSPFAPTHHVAKACLNKHAALLVIRDALKADQASTDKAIKIFLQDDNYTQLDEEVLKEHGMTVVNGAAGYRMGFVLVDENTLVVDFGLRGDVFPLLREIARPAAILRHSPLDVNNYRNLEEHCYFLLPVGRELYVPGLGT
jgi:hypothetical protein